jgi:O-antigen/teichoic acid export membrane protein
VAALGLYALVTGATAIADDVPAATVAWGAALVPAVLIRFLLDGLLWAQGRSRAASASLLLTALLQVAAIVTLAATDGLDSAAVLAVSAITTVLGSAPGVVALVRAVRDEHDQAATAPRELVRVGLQNHLGVLALWAALRLDVLVVAAVASERELGLYTLAVTLSELVLLATDSLALAALGEQGRTPREESGDLSVSVASSAARVAAVQAVVLMAVAWPGITFVYGEAWSDTVPVLIAMAPGTVALAYMRPLGPAFIRADRSLTRSGVMAGSAALNVAGALVLVPAIGIVGAGLATTASYWLGALVVAWLVRTRLGLPAWRPA